VLDSAGYASGLGKAGTAQGPLRRFIRAFIHFWSYHLFLKHSRTSVTRVAGFRLTVPPTVFHPKVFLTSKYFAGFIGSLDLKGKSVAEVGCGSGILSLAAARAGAARVVAIDINPKAAGAAASNARDNGLGDRVRGVCSNLMSGLKPGPLFDVIITSPPSFPGEPRDLADRAWHAGPGYRDIAALFDQARERLTPGGVVYLLLSSDSDLDRLGELIQRAHFSAHLVGKQSIFIEDFILYELRTFS
jgi:methylase of polypeptide subunit release factors